MPKANLNEGLALAGRLQTEVADISIETTQSPLTFTVSIGVAYNHKEGDTLNIVLKRSDEALYKAKNSGRNCIRSI